MKQATLCLILLSTTLLSTISTQGIAQNLELLKGYNQEIFYEMELDDQQNNVVYTHCEEPEDFLHINYNESLGTCHFTYDEIVFKVRSVEKGANPEEFLIKYKNEFGEDATAIFFYDKVVKNLFFTFDGMELAFITKDNLNQVKVIDTCNQK